MGRNPARDPPLRNRLFINTKDYENCRTKARDATVMVLSGPHGIGKRCTARQLIRTLMLEVNPNHRCFFDIDCSAANPTAAIAAAYPIPPDQRRFALHQLLLDTFVNMNQQAKDLSKFVLLDLTRLDKHEVVSNFLEQLLEEFCEDLGDDEELKKKWTILAAVTKADLINPAQFPQIGADNFIDFKGFAEVENIEEMITQQFRDEVDADVNFGRDYAQMIFDHLGLTRPMIVQLAVKYLDSYENPEEFFNSLTDNFGSKSTLKRDALKHNLMVFDLARHNIESCIKDCALEARHRNTFIAMLSLLDGAEIPKELLVALVECLPCDPDGHQVSAIAINLMMGLKKGDLCKRHVKPPGVPATYSIHPFIHEMMGNYLDDFNRIEKLEILMNVVVALIRRMPKDGGICDSEQIKCFYPHAVKINDTIDLMMAKLQGFCNDSFSSTMRILQSELRTKIAYCLIVLRADGKAEKFLTDALNLFHETVSGTDYRLHVTREFIDQSLAIQLYKDCQKARFILMPAFQKFIEKLIKFHVLTENCLYHMHDVVDEKYIVDDHLKLIGQDKLLRERRLLCTMRQGSKVVVDDVRLAKLYIAELLINIYITWSKLYLRLHSITCKTLERTRGDCKSLADVAVELCAQVYEDHDVYLLHTMISSRISLQYEILDVQSYEEADEVYQKWRPDKCGIIRRRSSAVAGAPTGAVAGAVAGAPTGAVAGAQALQTPDSQRNQSVQQSRSGGQNPSDSTSTDGGLSVGSLTKSDGSRKPSVTATPGKAPVSYGEQKANRRPAESTGKSSSGQQKDSVTTGRQQAQDTAGRQQAQDTAGRQQVQDTAGRQQVQDIPSRQQAQATAVSLSNQEGINVFECGIVKSVRDKDGYHKVRCLMGQLLSLGKKRQLASSRSELLQSDAKILIEDIQQSINITNHTREEAVSSRRYSLSLEDESSPIKMSSPYHATRSKAYRVFAQYYNDCGDHQEAIRSIIRAMEELRLSTKGKIDPRSLAFARLENDLKKYSTGTLPQRFIPPDAPEAHYARNIEDSMNPARGTIQPSSRHHKDVLNSMFAQVIQLRAITDEAPTQASGSEENEVIVLD